MQVHSETDASSAYSILKISSVSDGSRRSSAFQAIGPATENARRPSVLRRCRTWYDEMVAAGRSKSLTTGNIRRGVAAVYEVLGSPALETPVNRLGLRLAMGLIGLGLYLTVEGFG